MTTQIAKKDINLEELLELSKHNTFSTTALLRAVKEVSAEVNIQGAKIETIEKDIEYLKFDTEITDSQATFITSEVKRIARETVGYPSPLYRYAIHDIYSHLRTVWKMGGKVRTTTKGNFKTVAQGLATYKPDVEKLQEKLNAKLAMESM